MGMSKNDDVLAAKLFRNFRNRIAIALHRGQLPATLATFYYGGAWPSILYMVHVLLFTTLSCEHLAAATRRLVHRRRRRPFALFVFTWRDQFHPLRPQASHPRSPPDSPPVTMMVSHHRSAESMSKEEAKEEMAGDESVALDDKMKTLTGGSQSKDCCSSPKIFFPRRPFWTSCIEHPATQVNRGDVRSLAEWCMGSLAPPRFLQAVATTQTLLPRGARVGSA